MIENARYTAEGSIVATIDGTEWTVPDDMANSFRQRIAEWEAEGNTIAPYEPPETPAPVIVVFPADLWRRATDEEAEAIDQTMGAQPLRIRRIFTSALEYRSDDEMWSLLMGAATQLFGEARAAELLAPS